MGDVKSGGRNGVTGAQLRGGRGLLNMSVIDLAERTGLALNTIRKAEATNDDVPINAANARLIVATLEAAGIIFLPADGADVGVGVRLRDINQAPLEKRRRQPKGSRPDRPASG